MAGAGAGAGRRALSAETGQNGYNRAGVGGCVWDGAGWRSAGRAGRAANKARGSGDKRVALQKHRKRRCGAEGTWVARGGQNEPLAGA